jgi:hypothetical protein
MFSSKRSGILIAGLMLASTAADANDVEIVQARFRHSSPGTWSVEVTLRHADTGWEHYADAWRVITRDGTVLGTRTLYHPHVDEQPFTRDLAGVAIPLEIATVYVEAHDKVHGWSPQRVRVDLDEAKGERFEVSR